MVGYSCSFTSPFFKKHVGRFNGFAALRSSNYRVRNHFSFHTNNGLSNLNVNQNRYNTAREKGKNQFKELRSKIPNLIKKQKRIVPVIIYSLPLATGN